ncbi:MAG: nucleotidyltransferase domain-containing protein [Clostridia bacterium]|nr:nucleotidyltransferase domain-containing protein [Clostridia bacterium]
MLTRKEIEYAIRLLLARYHADHALLFGSYARGDATQESDLDVLVVGGSRFKKSNIFAFAEELREMTGKQADVFEISELDTDAPLYQTIFREGVKIA